jgi:hypothetical protein
VMIPDLSWTAERHRSPAYLNGQAAFGFQFPGSNSGRLAWVQGKRAVNPMVPNLF